MIIKIRQSILHRIYVFGLALFFFQSLAEAGPVFVDVSTVREQAYTDTQEVLGVVKTARSIDLVTQSSGQVIWRLESTNQRLRSGDLIVSLQDGQARQAYLQAQAVYQTDQAHFKRAKTIFRHGSIALDELEALKAKVSVSHAAFLAAKDRLEQTQVRAPVEGTLGMVTAEVGQYVQAGASVAHMTSDQTRYLDFSVPETSELKKGQSITMTDVRQRTYQGVIQCVDSMVDPRSRQIMVRAIVQGVDRPTTGSWLHIRIPGTHYPKVWSIPKSALSFNGEHYSTHVVRQGKAYRVGVQLVKKLEDKALVLGPLKPQDQVITRGSFKIYVDGTPVMAQS